jgi:hypothetical protein
MRLLKVVKMDKLKPVAASGLKPMVPRICGLKKIKQKIQTSAAAGPTKKRWYSGDAL